MQDGRTRVWIWLGAAVIAASTLAACGDEKTRDEMSREEVAEAVPFADRDLKEVLSAFPDDQRDIVEKADRVVLYTLNPIRMLDGKRSPETERFHDYGVLGKHEITDEDDHRKLVEAVYQGLKSEGASPASCFWPRHALRYERDDVIVDLLICFECTWIYISEGEADTQENRMLFGAGVKPVFDVLTAKHGLATAKR